MDISNSNREGGSGKANYLDILMEVDKFMAEKGMKIPVYTDKSWEQLSSQYENARKTEDTAGMRDALGEMLASYYQDQRPFSTEKRFFFEKTIPVVVVYSLARNSESGLADAARLLDNTRSTSGSILSSSVFADLGFMVADKAFGQGNLPVALHFASKAAVESRNVFQIFGRESDDYKAARIDRAVELLLKIGDEAENQTSCQTDTREIIAHNAYCEAYKAKAFDRALLIRSAKKAAAYLPQPS